MIRQIPPSSSARPSGRKFSRRERFATSSAPSARRNKKPLTPSAAPPRKPLAQEQLKLEALALEAEAQRKREEEERLEYERKLERDARYAARKERKKKKKSAAERYG